nr:hypothetical protein [uncultured Mucilaginibacter sp.]
MKNTSDTELPPFIRSWNQFYGVVIVWLVFLIIMFSLITLYYR